MSTLQEHGFKYRRPIYGGAWECAMQEEPSARKRVILRKNGRGFLVTVPGDARKYRFKEWNERGMLWKPCTHDLKIVEPYYSAVARGEKTFEVRYNDRAYEVGDTIRLHPYDADKQQYMRGRVLMFLITYILRDYPALDGGFVILQLKPL